MRELELKEKKEIERILAELSAEASNHAEEKPMKKRRPKKKTKTPWYGMKDCDK